MISRIPSTCVIQGLHSSVVLSEVHSNAFIKLSVFPSKPAKVSVTAAVVNMNRTFDNSQLGSSFFYLAFKQSPGKRSHLPFDSCKFLITNGIHLLWYVATSIDLGGNFLFQGFIHQPMWIRRTLNGEFIMMRNLWVAVIKFALAFTESFITHLLLLKQLIQGLTLLPLASCSSTVIWFISM